MSISINPSMSGGIFTMSNALSGNGNQVRLMNLDNSISIGPQMSGGAFTMSNAISGSNNQMRLQNLDGDIHIGAHIGNDGVFNAGWLTTASGQTLHGLQNLSGAHFTMKNISTGDDNTFQSLQNHCMMMTPNGDVPCDPSKWAMCSCVQ